MLMREIKFLAKVEIGFKAFNFNVTGDILEYLEHNEFKAEVHFNPPRSIEDCPKEDYEELLKLIETKLLEEWEIFNKEPEKSVWNQPYTARIFNVNVMPEDDGKISIDIKKG